MHGRRLVFAAVLLLTSESSVNAIQVITDRSYATITTTSGTCKVGVYIFTVARANKALWQAIRSNLQLEVSQTVSESILMPSLT
jgi:hypothetical protein